VGECLSTAVPSYSREEDLTGLCLFTVVVYKTFARPVTFFFLPFRFRIHSSEVCGPSNSLQVLESNQERPVPFTPDQLLLHARSLLSDSMEGWLKESGAVGLDALELADFPVTGRGIRTLRYFKEGERILTIPTDILWTVEHAYDDPLLGPPLRSARPPLSVDDALVMYILFVRSRESGYDGLRSHLAMVPKSYSSSIFFTEDELEVCAGTSLYTVTKRLERCIEDDYRALVVRLLGQYRDLFPLEKFTIEDVSIIRLVMDMRNDR
jgi:hypothetical protein